MTMSDVIRRRNLPHWDVPGAAYFVTTCLEGSIPARGLLEVEQFREQLRRQPRPRNVSAEQWRIQCWKRCFVRIERWLDDAPARRDLEMPALAQEVVKSMY